MSSGTVSTSPNPDHHEVSLPENTTNGGSNNTPRTMSAQFLPTKTDTNRPCSNDQQGNGKELAEEHPLHIESIQQDCTARQDKQSGESQESDC